MSKLAVYNSKGKEIGALTVDKEIMDGRVNSRLLYYAKNYYRAALHRGTHKTKKRDEVRGGGKKPWRQKGTGRARSGSIRNPIWRGGGIVFGPNPRSYTHAMPVKAKRLATAEAVKSKIQSDSIVVFDGISLEKPRTKDMASIIKSMKLGKKCLMVTERIGPNVILASRNISGFLVKNRKDVNALDVLRHDKLAIAKDSLQKMLEGPK